MAPEKNTGAKGLTLSMRSTPCRATAAYFSLPHWYAVCGRASAHSHHVAPFRASMKEHFMSGNASRWIAAGSSVVLMGGMAMLAFSQQPAPRQTRPRPAGDAARAPADAPARAPADARARPRPDADAVNDAQTPRDVEAKRTEQKRSKHDQSDIFAAGGAPPITEALKDQPDEGKVVGFDFSKDPFGAKKV